MRKYCGREFSRNISQISPQNAGMKFWSEFHLISSERLLLQSIKRSCLNYRVGINFDYLLIITQRPRKEFESREAIKRAHTSSMERFSENDLKAGP